MNTIFYILLSVKTAEGMETYGRFDIGNDRQAAHDLFGMLKGNDYVQENNMLYLELTETVDNLPVNMQMKTCTLRELGENCALITKEIFKSRIQHD